MSGKTQCYFNDPVVTCKYGFSGLHVNGVIGLSITSLVVLGALGALFIRRTERGRRLSLSVTDGGRRLSRRMSLIAKTSKDKDDLQVGSPLFRMEEDNTTTSFQVITSLDNQFNNTERRVKKKSQGKPKHVGFTIYETGDTLPGGATI
jgi:hypothetical protein